MIELSTLLSPLGLGAAMSVIGISFFAILVKRTLWPKAKPTRKIHYCFWRGCTLEAVEVYGTRFNFCDKHGTLLPIEKPGEVEVKVDASEAAKQINALMERFAPVPRLVAEVKRRYSHQVLINLTNPQNATATTVNENRLYAAAEDVIERSKGWLISDCCDAVMNRLKGTWRPYPDGVEATITIGDKVIPAGQPIMFDEAMQVMNLPMEVRIGKAETARVAWRDEFKVRDWVRHKQHGLGRIGYTVDRYVSVQFEDTYRGAIYVGDLEPGFPRTGEWWRHSKGDTGKSIKAEFNHMRPCSGGVDCMVPVNFGRGEQHPDVDFSCPCCGQEILRGGTSTIWAEVYCPCRCGQQHRFEFKVGAKTRWVGDEQSPDPTTETGSVTGSRPWKKSTSSGGSRSSGKETGGKFKPGDWVRYRLTGELFQLGHLWPITELANGDWCIECLKDGSCSLMHESDIEPALPHKGEWWQKDRMCPDHRSGVGMCMFEYDGFTVGFHEYKAPGWRADHAELIKCGCLVPLNFGRGHDAR